MPELHVDDMQDGYIELVEYVTAQGVRRAPRGKATLDVEDLTLVLHDPANALTEHIGRRASTRLAALEAVQLVAGASYPDLMTRVAPNTKAFLSADGSFHGAYGPRLRAAIPLVIRRLVQDKDTRQAVATIFSSERDLHDGIVDVPCTTLLMYKIERDSLHAKTVMRSNDVWWGTAHDVFMFTMLQRTIAEFLGVEVGWYRHNAYSMHMYESNLDAASELHRPTWPATIAPPLWESAWGVADRGGMTWGTVSYAATALAANTPLSYHTTWWQDMAASWYR